MNINSLSVYNEQNPNSILSYSYTLGDRCTIHRQDGNWVSGYDVQVVAFESASGGILTIQKDAALSAGVSGLLLEVYTPKTRANTSKEKFFFEFGVVYDCVAVSGVNKHSVSAGAFTAGDIYDKGRVINTVNYQLEDYYPDSKNTINGNRYAALVLDPQKDLTSLGYNRGILNTQYNFLRKLFNSSFGTFYWIKEISSSRTEITCQGRFLQ